jgi:hypothetical protein
MAINEITANDLPPRQCWWQCQGSAGGSATAHGGVTAKTARHIRKIKKCLLRLKCT